VSENPMKLIRALARSGRRQRVVHLAPDRMWPWAEKLMEEGYMLRRLEDGAVLATRGMRRIKILRA
jgi:hypothetical protein